jgi:hypothetical protein
MAMPVAADIARLRLHQPASEREFVRRADLERVDHDGCCWISLRFLRGPRTPGPGEDLYLLDDDGRGCVGTVERVDGWHACVRPDWRTLALSSSR